MRKEIPTRHQLQLQIQELQARLEEARDTLRAIRSGEVDAVVVPGSQGDQVFTLQGADQPYRILVETMNEGTATLLPDGMIAYSNSRFADTVRAPLEHVIGASFMRFLSAREQPSFSALLVRSRNGGAKAEFALLAGDGIVVPAQISARPVGDTPSRGFCLVITALTEHYQAEDECAYMAAIVESCDDAIIGKSPAGVIQSWNRGAERLYGYTASEAIGRPISLLAPPERRKEIAEFLSRIKRGEAIEHFETTRVAKNGRHIDVSVTISPLKNAAGEVVGASAIARDITERKRADQELWRMNRALRTISEGKKVIVRATEEIPLLVGICNTFVREGGYRMAWVGFAEQDEGKSVRPVAHAGYEDGYLQTAQISWAGTERGRGPVGTAIRTGKPVVARSVRSDDSVAPSPDQQLQRGYASLIALPLLLQGRALGALTIYAEAPDAFDCEEMQLLTGLSEDLAYGIQTLRTRAERQRAEEALAKQTRQLMYSQEALKQKAQELSRSNAELQQFAYVASHDLQEPLRTMASFAQLLQRRYQGRLDASADDFIHFIVDGAARMQGLIQDLLAYSRVGSRGKDLVPTDCMAVFDQAIANLRAAIAESAAVVTRDPLPTVPGDGEQLVQVFQNLIGNSIKFRATAAPQIHVAAEQRPADWVFYVKDNGIGIDPQYARRIFEVFQRLHNRTQYPGSGIGLAITKKIVERHGGHIWVDSQPQKGATFIFTLPI